MIRLNTPPAPGVAHDFEELFRLGPLPAYVFDPATLRFLAVNDATVRLYGYSREEFLGMSIENIRPPDDIVRLRQEVAANVKRSFATYRGEWRHRTKTGEILPVEIFAEPIAFRGQTAFLVIALDITERVSAQEALRRSNEQLRRVSARARARREEDRTRIARELHDQLGQALAALKIDVHWLGERFAGAPASRDEIDGKITHMSRLLDDTIWRVRRISAELRPAVLDKLGLVAAIEWQAQEIERGSGTHVRVQSAVDRASIDLGRSTTVFRIVEEALSNVAMHASATLVTVRLSEKNGWLTVQITDNGRGIKPEELASGRSLGLIGMRERASLLDGSVDVNPGPKQGTVVTVKVPIAERRRAVRDDWS